MHRSDPLLKMKLVPKVTADSKNVLLQNKDSSLTTGCLTGNLHHDWNKLDLKSSGGSRLEVPVKKAGRTSELCTQNSTPGPLF